MVFKSIGIACLVLTLFALSAQADTLASFTGGTTTVLISASAAQSATTSAGGPWNNIGFAFLTINGSNAAGGDLFLLSSEYLGAPGNLSSSTPGFIAQSTGIAGGAWTFAASLTLLPNTEYFFYSNYLFPANTLSSDLGNPYSGGTAYACCYAGGPLNFGDAGGELDFNFRLTGTVVAAPVPEPSTLLFCLAGLGIAASLQRRHVSR